MEHELSAQTDGLRDRSISGRRAEELFLEGLAGELTFHGWLSLYVKPGIWILHPIGFYRKLRTSPFNVACVADTPAFSGFVIAFTEVDPKN